MALDVNDLAMLKGLESKDMSPFEQFVVADKQSKKPSAVAVTGLVFGGTALVGVLATAVLNNMYANAKASQAKEAAQGAKEVAMAYYAGVDKRLDNIGALLESEVNRRIAGDTTISQTITDTISGQQSAAQSSQVSQTSAIDTSVQQIMTQTFADAVTGKSSLNPTPVMIYSAPQPCNCPGCGCNG